MNKNRPPSILHPYVATEKPNYKYIDQWYNQLREQGYSVFEAFDALKQEMLDIGWRPEEFGLKDDPDSFRRAVNQRKNRSNRQK